MIGSEVKMSGRSFAMLVEERWDRLHLLIHHSPQRTNCCLHVKGHTQAYSHSIKILIIRNFF